MSTTIPEIGSGLPGAAEVEPPATIVRQAGGSAQIVQAATQAALLIAEATDWKDRDPRLQEAIGILTVAIASDSSAGPGGMAAIGADMGVTGNAILLLGYAGGCLVGAPDALYAVEEADPRAGTLQVRRHGTDNTYRISVVQLEGIE